MVTSVDDILDELRYTRPTVSDAEPPIESEGPKTAALSDLEAAILDCFKGGELCQPDKICQQTGRTAAEVSGCLMGLEIKRLISKRADGCFEAR